MFYMPRSWLWYHLFQLAQDKQFVQRLIPDECGLDMRALISLLVEHDPRHRYSATQALKSEYGEAGLPMYYWQVIVWCLRKAETKQDEFVCFCWKFCFGIKNIECFPSVTKRAVTQNTLLLFHLKHAI